MKESGLISTIEPSTMFIFSLAIRSSTYGDFLAAQMTLKA